MDARIPLRLCDQIRSLAILGVLMSDMDTIVQSPCIRNCCLDDALTCLGCFRSLEEIKEWGIVDNRRRQTILQNAKQRREANQMPVEASLTPRMTVC